jgi:hypothetical protein
MYTFVNCLAEDNLWGLKHKGGASQNTKVIFGYSCMQLD